MKTIEIALICGDGIGEEVTEAFRRVLGAAAAQEKDIRLELTDYPAGEKAYSNTGEVLPAETLAGIRKSRAAFLGALSGKRMPPPSPVGRLRKTLDLFADVRLIRSYPGVWSLRPDIDMVIIRENTQGFLADRSLYKGYGEFMPDEDTLLSLRVLTRKACERIAAFAFDYALKHGRKKITAAHKANVLRMGGEFFLGICKGTSKKYPALEFEDELVDSLANNLIKTPQNYDVILTTNLFGDILSDMAAALVSSLVPTMNVGDDCVVFKPVHEAELSIAGKDAVNPLSAILCAGQMLRWLGLYAAADKIDRAVKTVLTETGLRTADLGGETSTREMTQAIIKVVNKN